MDADGQKKKSPFIGVKVEPDSGGGGDGPTLRDAPLLHHRPPVQTKSIAQSNFPSNVVDAIIGAAVSSATITRSSPSGFRLYPAMEDESESRRRRRRLSTPPSSPHPRQTPSNVCAQCRRLRRKCDRQIPCSTCIRRQISHLCHRDEAPSSQIQARAPPSATSLPTAGSLTPSSNDLPQVPLNSAHVPVAQHAATVRPSQSDAFGSSRIGHLWNTRGAPSYHGPSHFSYQSAASMMQMESPELPIGMSSIHTSNTRSHPDNQFHRGEKGPYAHIWELVGYLPRRKAFVDQLVQKFFDELNPVYDSVHKETFHVGYDAFWNRKWGDDDLTAVDLRWLALLFMMLAFAELLECPLDATAEGQRAYEETSMQFFWASRKAIVLAPTFSGESPDLVRAGILVSRYLMYFGRKTESWLTSSFAIRMAQAQGMHIDGESWGLPPKVLETRRRLWCSLYSLDRSISLAIGRPYTINPKHCMKMNIRNVWIDEMANEDAAAVQEQPLTDPTPSIYYFYHQRLSSILGDIHDDCFTLIPMTTSYNTYEKVLNLDRALLDWAACLPPYFQLQDADCSMDNSRPYLYWQRMYLHSAYHFARITLHRAYVLLESITDRFQYSRDACISSACADLRLKLSLRPRSMADRLKSGVAMHNFFNSALILGIIAVRDPSSARTSAILEDLAAYCEKLRADTWTNEFALAEVKVIELCISSARKTSREGSAMERRGEAAMGLRASNTAEHPVELGEAGLQNATHRAQTSWPAVDQDAGQAAADMNNGMGPCESWLDSWFGPTRIFPEPIDYHFWEELVGTLEAR